MLGFIGAGNMAQAIVKGILKSGFYPASDIIMSATSERTIDGVRVTTNNDEVIALSDTVIISVKPQMAAAVLSKLKVSTPSPLFISVMAGLTTDKVESFFSNKICLVRAMPNTPAQVQMGCTVLSKGTHADDEDMTMATRIFECVGTVTVVKEGLIDAASAISGCGPAYFYMIIEALSDAGVKAGLPRKEALKLATQTALGSAQMIIDSGKHPAELKDMVTSPAGTTIAALSVLEDYSVRAAFINAVEAAVERSKEL
ncbi:MAG: pyrroline-5-carboxylate reductase [Deferribacteraceae bacterium]|jgi:pyrroline-5-carboxylate reductase|nr:pyrroline-5-carboxylate reductase [Deferribacteraceae bacterium]